MYIDKITCIVVIILVVALLWCFSSKNFSMKCGTERDSYKYNPQTYYDHGGWIDHPPQVPNYGDVEHLTFPSGMSQEYGNLCKECIERCGVELHTGIAKKKKGESDKDYCKKKCKLVCTIFS